MTDGKFKQIFKLTPENIEEFIRLYSKGDSFYPLYSELHSLSKVCKELHEKADKTKELIEKEGASYVTAVLSELSQFDTEIYGYTEMAKETGFQGDELVFNHYLKLGSMDLDVNSSCVCSDLELYLLKADCESDFYQRSVDILGAIRPVLRTIYSKYPELKEKEVTP